MTRRALAVTGYCLCALLVSAAAEGSWVFWMMGEGSPWDRVATFQTREECLAAMHEQAQAVEKRGLAVTEDMAGGSFVGADADRRLRGQCLPDTVDPREREVR
jgi:hypothetical protein